MFRGILFRPDAPSGGPGAAPAAPAVPAAGEVVGTTPGGVAIKASGVVDGQPPEALDFKAAGRAFLAGGGQTAQTTNVGGTEVRLEAAGDDDLGADDTLPPGDVSTATDGEDPAADPNAPPADPAAAAEGEGAEEFVSITLPGLAERGEADIEAEVTPELAERIQRLRNDGMRRKAYDEAIVGVEQREAELAAIDQALSIDPVGFTLNRMTPERQIEVARALVLEHFDALLPDLIKYDSDAAARQEARVALRDRMRGTEQQLTAATASQQRAAVVMRAVTSLVPENTDPDVARQFARDAERDLIEAHRSGRPVTPDAVPALLATRLSLYGFAAASAGPAAGGATRSTPAAAPAAAADPATARPVTDRAKAIADRKPAVQRQQARIATTQAARRSAAAIAPAGAGAGAVSAPPVSQSADIREASKELRKKGLAQTWAPT